MLGRGILKLVKIIVLCLVLLGLAACNQDSTPNNDSVPGTLVPAVHSKENDTPSLSVDEPTATADSNGEQCLPCMEKADDLSSVQSDEGPTFSATVLRIIDGDTIEVVLEDGTEDTVRLLGVDTPETYGSNNAGEYRDITDLNCLDKWGSKATEFAKQWLGGAKITLILDPAAGERGYYGRLLAYVHIGDEDFNESLLENGYARVYTEGTSSREHQYVLSQRVAITENRGLWACGKTGE